MMLRRGGNLRPVLRALLLALLALMSCLAAASPAAAKPSEHPFEIVPGSFHLAPSTLRAGAHDDLTTTFDFAHEELPGSPNTNTYNDVRTVTVNLPPGFIGNNTAVPTCTNAQLLAIAGERTNAAQCPIASQVGLVSFEVPPAGGHGSAPSHFTVPIYNMEVTSFGVTAELGFKSVVFTQVLQVHVRPGDSGITVTTPDISKLEPRNVRVTIWGVPAAHEHDAERGETCGESFEVPAVCHNEFGGPQEARVQAVPYLANPTSCQTFTPTMEAYSWEEPFHSSFAEDTIGPLAQCERVPFEPSMRVAPTTSFAESPSGLNVTLQLPQDWEHPNSLATSHLKDTKVTLPVGYTINPGAGSGLGVCTLAQLEADTSLGMPGEGCPEESKIGTVSVETPVLAEKLEGAIYIAKPYEEPLGSLLQLYIVVRSPQRGIVVRLKGRIEPNPVTGQLVTTFLNNPQVPFSRFTLKLRQGTTSPLVSPPACGSYTAEGQLTPWSAPASPVRVLAPPFAIERGIGGGPCPPGGIPPFGPSVLAGTNNNAAGGYSPFYLRIVRNDGEQEITRFTTVLPPGLTANLTGIPFCSDRAIQHAREATGRQEIGEPSCPAASEIGHTLVGAGVGGVLAWTPGKVYLGGPYHGSALSIVSVTSAKVGPFDLGTVVIRFALRINPLTGQAEIDSTGSDPIPHILLPGIVVHVRDIHVYIDRSKFMLNPTSCERLSISNTITGAGADPANPAGQQSVNTSTPFQAANCANLAFKPIFRVSTSGKTSRQNGASLHVTVVYPNGSQGAQANIRAVKVDLPRHLPSRLTTLQKACPHRVFEANPASCPPESAVGSALVHTQLLPVPLAGPAYFVSNGGEEFPNLIVVLQGYGVTIHLVGSTFIRHGVTSSTFRSTPDLPFETFELTLPEGKFSALAANGNLCTAGKTVTVSKRVKRRVHGRLQTVTVKVTQKGPGLVMPTALIAQNGAAIHQNTSIAVAGCPPVPARGKAKAHRARRAAGSKGR
jgi:hypothetical protein